MGAQFLVELCLECLSQARKLSPEPNPTRFEPILCLKNDQKPPKLSFLSKIGPGGGNLTKNGPKTPKLAVFRSKRGSLSPRPWIIGVLVKNRPKIPKIVVFGGYFRLDGGVFPQKNPHKFCHIQGYPLGVHKKGPFLAPSEANFGSK